MFVQAGKLDQILLPIHFRPGYIYIKPPFPPVIRTEKEHSLTTGLCLHWKRWQYLKKGKHLGHECEFSLCSTSMRQSGGTCLCAAQPAHMEVAVQLCLCTLPAPRVCLWPVPSPWCPVSSGRTCTRKGCIKPSTCTAQYGHASGRAGKETCHRETCHHTVRQIFKDLYYTPWGSDSAHVALSGRFPTPQVVSLDSIAVSLKSRCRNCLEHTMPQAPIHISIFMLFRGLDLAVLFLTA